MVSLTHSLTHSFAFIYKDNRCVELKKMATNTPMSLGGDQTLVIKKSKFISFQKIVPVLTSLATNSVMFIIEYFVLQ